MSVIKKTKVRKHLFPFEARVPSPFERQPCTRDSVLVHLGDLFFDKKTSIHHKINLSRILLENLGGHEAQGSVLRANKLIEALLK